MPKQERITTVNEYRRHGIEWSITGDVHEEQFETFRAKFNQIIFAALEAEHGQGYLDSLSKAIDARVSRK